MITRVNRNYLDRIWFVENALNHARLISHFAKEANNLNSLVVVPCLPFSETPYQPIQ